MSDRPDNELNKLLDAVIAGRSDELSPQQIDRLAAHLDASPHAAARLAHASPPAQSVASAISMPAAAAFERVWTGVQQAGVARESRRGSHRVIRFVQSATALAACIGIAVLLQRGGFSQRPHTMQIATGVEISELDVAAGYTAKVDLNEDDGSAIIWVFESDDNEGV